MSADAEARRAARSTWQSRVFRDDVAAEMAEADSRFWTEIPIDQRAEVVWRLSAELFAIAEPSTNERRLPRSAFRPVRR